MPVKTQREACHAYAASKGWTVTEVIEDLDVSGKDLERPGMTDLRKRWREFDHVIAHKLDRLSRSLTDFMQLHAEAEAAGCHLATVSDSLDMSTPSGRFVAQILASFAEYERETIRTRILNGKATSRNEGRFQGGRIPYGFRAENGVLVVDERQAEVIRQVIARRADGESWGSLARYVQDQNLTSRRWDTQSLKRAIKLPKLNGTVLDPATYLLAVELAQPSKPGDWTPRAKRLLSGLLKCATCGATLSVMARSVGRPKYVCGDQNCTARAGVDCGQVESAIEKVYLNGPGKAEHIIRRRVIDDRAEKIASIKARLADINAEWNTPGAAVMELAGERVTLEAELGQLEADKATGSLFIRTGKTLAEVWESSDTAGRRDLLKSYVDFWTVDYAPSRDLKPGRLHPVLKGEGKTPEQILGLDPQDRSLISQN